MGLIQCMKTQHATGTLLNTYTTAKSVINPQALWVIPAGYLQVGDSLVVSVQGAISNVVTSQPTFTFQCMMGSIVVHTSGAITTTTSAHVTIPFFYEAHLTLDSEGSGTAAKFRGQGKAEGQMFLYSSATADSTLGLATIMGPNTAPAVGTGFDSTIANIFDFWVGISASLSTNGIQIHQYKVRLESERN
jgi:hypothetical protein